MKSLRDILKRKRNFTKIKFRLEGDDKAIIKLSQEMIISEAKNVDPEDIQEICYWKKKITIKTVHPAIASEIWRKRENIVKKINEYAEKEIIEKIVIK
jgi:hypothetical protein